MNTQSSLDTLNAQVTAAILRAEALPEGSRAARSAFREVSELEQRIAGLTSPAELEGEIARIGAVIAARSAGMPLTALHLAQRYAAEPIRLETRVKIEDLRKEIESDVRLRGSEAIAELDETRESFSRRLDPFPAPATALGPDQAARVLEILGQWTARGWWYECRFDSGKIRVDYQDPSDESDELHSSGVNHFDAICQATVAMQILLEEHPPLSEAKS